MEKEVKALKELNEAAASMQAEFKNKIETMKADGYKSADCCDENKMADIMNYCYNMFSSINERISRLSNDMYDYQYRHSKGHLPPITSASAMKKGLKAFGIEDDYEILKPYISVASTKNGKVLEAEYVKK